MKKVLATLLASTMALSAIAGLTACGGDKDNGKTLNVWAPEAAIETYKARAAVWKAENPEYSDWTVNFSVHAEGEVETELSMDPKSGGDIIFFESGQIQTMQKKLYLQTLLPEYTQQIKARDSETSYSPVLDANGNAFAFPCTSDNGYFLYYDKTFYDEEDVKSLDTMLAKAKAQGKKIGFDYGNGYYEVTWFFGTGCEMDWLDEAQTQYYTNLSTTEAGTLAGKASIKYLADAATEARPEGVFVSGDVTGTIGAGFEDGSMVAGIGGTWVAADKALEKRVVAGGRVYANVVAAAKLPEFTVEGKSYQMGSFVGGKYCGINRFRNNAESIMASMSLANYFCDQAGQQARFEATNAGPTNKAVADTDAVKNDMLIKALNEQNAKGGYTQLSQNGLWDAMADFGNKCASGDNTEANLAEKLGDLATAMAKGGDLVTTKA